ncbi:restriction endonuclease subunit S [Streptomyces sp. NPDC000229]|uniref:restriction endonuclease subunit S n=1 Tax=Streptomyces sp. NPDC000229 TaxID=3154247 RepID=UPI00332AB36D
MNTTNWQTVPLWSVATETRVAVDPADLGDQVVHYSIPAVDATGTGQVEATDSIKSAKLRLQGGEVLVSKLNPRKSRVLIVPNSPLPIVSSTEFVGLLPGAKLEPRFLAYFLQSEVTRQVLDSQVQSVTRSHQRVAPEDVTHLPVRLPSMDEQRRIANFLDAETARIKQIGAKRLKQMDLLTERRTAALAECVSSDGPDSIQHPLVGTVPHTWPVLPLRRVIPAVNVGVVVNPSSYFTDDGVPFIHGFNVRSGWIEPHGMKFMSHESNEELHRSRVRSGDVLVVRAGSPGRAAVVTEEYDGANCASVLILRRGRAMLPQFLSAFINSPAGRGQVQVSQYGAAQEVISAAQTLSFVAPVPDVSEQQYRVDRLNALLNKQDQVVSKLQRQASLLAERRQALITSAVSGQFDVSTASGRNVTEGVTV